MTSDCCNATLIIDKNVKGFFQDQVTTALKNQQVEASTDTTNYIVNLLTAFTHAKALFDHTPDGPMIKPLALTYSEAVEAKTTEARNQALRRLGDIALFISGIFPHSLNRKLVDIDYYIAMGGNAYSYLSDVSQTAWRWQLYSEVFAELADKFNAFVDVLGEVSDQSNMSNDTDTMRLYELWLRTGSKRSARRLRKLGIQPICGSNSRRHH